MIQFKSLRQYTHVVDGIRFPNKPGENFIVTYFSENSSFLEDYPKLNLKLVDIKINIIPVTRIPRTRITQNLIKAFKKYGIYSYSSIMKVPTSKNVFYDLTVYLNAIDSTFNPSNYRQRLSLFIKNIVNQSYSDFNNFEKVLMYTIDLTKDNLNKFVDRKFFPIVQQLKEGTFEFDHLILCLITSSGVRYRLLVKNKNFKFERIVTILKTIKSGKIETSLDTSDEVEDDETDQIVDQVMNTIHAKIKPENKEQVRDAVQSYLQKDPVAKEKIASKQVSASGLEKVGVASILSKVSGDVNKAKKITNSISKKKLVIH